jgi:glycosyltransferase involved in cell wall biosynthesis
MKRILVLNNYSIKRVLKEFEEGKKPSHHLYGVVELKKRGYPIIIIDPNFNSLFFRLSNVLRKIPFCYIGNLQQQFAALIKYRKYDIIYAPCQDTTIFLGILSFFKLFKKPIVALAHHPFLNGKLGWGRKISLYCSINGHHSFPALSNIVANQLNSISRNTISKEMHWGPDLHFYKSTIVSKSEENFKYDLVAIGRTGRDYTTFIKAFINTNIIVKIYCNILLKSQIPTKLTDNISIEFLKSDEELTYKEIIAIYHSARILAIPMIAQDSLCGLTSITDGIAIGMPILVTKNKFINIDPVENYFGCWINANDIQEWFNAANKILNDRSLFETMGNNARNTAQYNFNILHFTKELVELIEQVN